MNSKEIYRIWAPYGQRWVDWVRPVPFINIDHNLPHHEIIDYTIPHINYIKSIAEDTAIIIDTNSIQSIKEGIALALIGYRPIPIFNGTNPPSNTKGTTDNSLIEPLLIWGAYQLEKIKLKSDAPPVFLLDQNRLNRYKTDRSIFDNSWDIYPQDLPSAEYFLNKGITKIIVRGEKVNKDLRKILAKYQKNNLKIFFTNGYDSPEEIRLRK